MRYLNWFDFVQTMLVIGNRRSKIEIQVEPLSEDEMDDMTEDIVESLLEWQEELDEKIMEIHGVGGFRGAVQKMNSESNFCDSNRFELQRRSSRFTASSRLYRSSHISENKGELPEVARTASLATLFAASNAVLLFHRPISVSVAMPPQVRVLVIRCGDGSG